MQTFINQKAIEASRTKNSGGDFSKSEYNYTN